MNELSNYTPTTGGPAPTLQDAGGSVGILGMMHMHWRSLNEPDGPQMQLATPFPLGVPPAIRPETPAPDAAGEAGERELRAVVAAALEHDAPRVKLGSFNWPFFMRALLKRLDAAQAVAESAFQDAAAAREAHAAEVAGLRAGWVPVGERLPERNGYVLASTSGIGANGGAVFSAWFTGEWWYEDDDTGEYDSHPAKFQRDNATVQVSHWQPLPSPPTPWLSA